MKSIIETLVGATSPRAFMSAIRSASIRVDTQSTRAKDARRGSSVRRLANIGVIGMLFVLNPTAAWSAAPGMTSSARITSIFARDVGLDVALASTAGNPMACAQALNFRIVPSATNYQAIVAVLLSAQAQGKPVAVWVTSCADDGASFFVAVQTVS
jgi:hypothetical protein